MSGMPETQNEVPKSRIKEYHVKFHELCYQQYMNEFERTDKPHEKTGMWITAMIAIGAAAYAQGSIDLIDIPYPVTNCTFLYFRKTVHFGRWSKA